MGQQNLLCLSNQRAALHQRRTDAQNTDLPGERWKAIPGRIYILVRSMLFGCYACVHMNKEHRYTCRLRYSHDEGFYVFIRPLYIEVTMYIIFYCCAYAQMNRKHTYRVCPQCGLLCSCETFLFPMKNYLKLWKTSF